MSSASKIKFKRKLANFFGGLGYFFVAFQWLLAVLVYSNFIKSLLSAFTPVVTKPVSTTPIVINLASNTPLMIVGVVITLAVVVLSIYIFVKIPTTIVKTTKNVVHEVAETTAPVVLHVQHVHDTKPSRRKIILRITVIIKALIIIAPLVLSFCSQFTAHQTFDFFLTMYMSLWLAGLATVSFVLQYALAGLLAVKRQDIW